MASAVHQHEHKQRASRATYSVLTLAAAAVLCAAKRTAVDLLQTTCRLLAW